MTLDENGYPDQRALSDIASWDLTKLGIYGLLEKIKKNTKWADRQVEIKGKRVIRFVYHTGGWSGNENVIDALERNTLFWILFWQKSVRGGHYYFKIEHPERYPFIGVQ